MLYLEAAESAPHICFSRSAKDPFIFPHEPDLAGSWQAQRCSLDSLQHGMRSGQQGKRNSWVAARHREQTQQGLETFFPFLPFWFTQWDFVPGPGGASCCGLCCRCMEHMGTATAVPAHPARLLGLATRPHEQFDPDFPGWLSHLALPLYFSNWKIFLEFGNGNWSYEWKIFHFQMEKFPNFPFQSHFFSFFFFPCHSGKI